MLTLGGDENEMLAKCDSLVVVESPETVVDILKFATPTLFLQINGGADWVSTVLAWRRLPSH